MYTIGKYAEDDSMSDLICENYSMLLVMSRFGIALGFGDQTIGQVCAHHQVDVNTFLAIVNLLTTEDKVAAQPADTEPIVVRSLIAYLRNSHNYFLNFKLPAIRQKLIEVIDAGTGDVARLIIRFYDDYVAEVSKHMMYEEKTVFPYVEQLLDGVGESKYNIDTYSRQHDKVEAKLSELKNIIIRFYSVGSTNELNGVLFDIFACAADLASHNDVEDYLFVPAIRRVEQQH